MKEINEQIATGFDKFLEYFSPATIDTQKFSLSLKWIIKRK